MDETKRIIGRPKVSSEYATEYWKEMDDQFKKTIQRTNTTSWQTWSSISS